MSLVVDNLEKIKGILKFDKNDRPDNFYKFTLMIRDKDCQNHPFLNKYRKEYIVKDWLIESQEMYERHIDEFRFLTNLIKGRLYFTSEMKSLEKSLDLLSHEVLNRAKEHYKNPMQGSARMLPKLLSSITSRVESSARNGRMVLFDVDTKDIEVVEELKEKLGKAYIECLDSKNGYHVLAERTFDTRKFELPRDTTLVVNGLVLAYANLESY